MKQFFAGFASALALVAVGAIAYTQLGWFPIEADGGLFFQERTFAHHTIDASLRRKAPPGGNPLAVTPANLRDGVQLYKENCVGCHGGPVKAPNAFAASLLPPVPQFNEDAPDLPDNQTFYLIKHGLRMTAMPAYGSASNPQLKDEEIWKIAMFLSHYDKLPPEANALWHDLPTATSTAPAAK